MTTMKEQIKEIHTDINDRFENIKAVKGEKFHDVARFALNMLQINDITSTYAQSVNGNSLKTAMLMMVIVEKTMEGLIDYRKAIGLNQEDCEEAVKMAADILRSSNEHAARICEA